MVGGDGDAQAFADKRQLADMAALEELRPLPLIVTPVGGNRHAPEDMPILK